MTVKDYNRSVEDFSDSVYRFILGNIKDEDRADVIVQDTWEKLCRNLTEIEYPVVRSWLFKTAYRTMIDIIRKESRMTRIEESDYQDFLSETQYSDLNEILHLALDRLPEHHRSLVLLRDYEGYSYREISEISGMTEAQVKINLYRGRVPLRNFIVKIESVI